MRDLSLQLKALLKSYGIKLDWDEFSFQFQSHPSYPSLHAATGVLDHFNIENVAARIPVSKETLIELPQYCIIQISNKDQLGLVLLEKQNNEFIIYKEDHSKLKIKSGQLLKEFTGIILAVEKDEDIIQKSPKKNHLNLIASIIAILSLIPVFIFNGVPFSFCITFVLSLIGVLISTSIVKQEFGLKDLIGEALCSSENEKKDCNAVLSSEGAKVIGNFKLSDLCLIYFTGFSLALVLLQTQSLNLFTALLVSMIAIPVTFYSIYYQAFVIKKWCALCLSVVGVLWLQASIPLLFGSFQIKFNFAILEISSLVFSFASAFSVWNYLKPKYKTLQDSKREKLEYYRFKRNFDIFSALLTNNKPIDTIVNQNDEIILGNPKSELELLVVTNPFCGHCRKVHSLVENILHKSADNLKVVIRFNINLSKPDSDIVKLCSQLQHLYKTQPDKILQALDDAYNNLNFEEWINKWANSTVDCDNYLKLFTVQKDWCTVNKINFTPHLALNGYAYPKEYDREELSFFIEDLIDDDNEIFTKKKRLQTAI